MQKATAIAPEAVGLRKRLSTLKLPDSPVSKPHASLEDDRGMLCAENEVEFENGDCGSYFGHTRSFSSVSESSHSTSSSEPGLNGTNGDAVAEKRKLSAGEAMGGMSPSPPQALHSASRLPSRLQRRAPRSTSGSNVRRSHKPKSGSSWLGYDLSIIVALVSPIGNLLTGSDHIKNILLLLLLIYYLHQLVEVPWTLYRMSIPPHSLLSTAPQITNSTKHAAHAELRVLELFYLVLTIISPFLGAIVLKYIATAISGNPETLSWFSTSLFVLATGVRPWSHLVERLKDRSYALSALLEADSEDQGEQGPPEADVRDAERDREVGDLHNQLKALDTRLVDLTTSHVHEWDDLAVSVDGVEASLRKDRAEVTRKLEAHENRLNDLEAYVLALQYANGQNRTHSNCATYFRTLPRKVVAALRAGVLWLAAWLPLPSNRTTKRGRVKVAALPSTSASTLEPILEEEAVSGSRFPDSDSDHTVVGKLAEHPKLRRNSGSAEHPADAFSQVGDFLLSPARLVLRVTISFVGLPLAILRAILRQ
ncbi:hypothetical protein EW145_g7637 [Phellinidium pouzarii]|uniref:Uncharacterized protein n=1 Tax=Phellinidium pouzarii TaxID=167371 RepID=A0A4S4KH74_9AGAM|nr:hypothetical protein EW145_g7637 [Phellinidium pouzarii]